MQSCRHTAASPTPRCPPASLTPIPDVPAGCSVPVRGGFTAAHGAPAILCPSVLLAVGRRPCLTRPICCRVDVNGDRRISAKEMQRWIVEKTAEHFQEAVEESRAHFHAVDPDGDGTDSAGPGGPGRRTGEPEGPQGTCLRGHVPARSAGQEGRVEVGAGCLRASASTVCVWDFIGSGRRKE